MIKSYFKIWVRKKTVHNPPLMIRMNLLTPGSPAVSKPLPFMATNRTTTASMHCERKCRKKITLKFFLIKKLCLVIYDVIKQVYRRTHKRCWGRGGWGAVCFNVFVRSRETTFGACSKLLIIKVMNGPRHHINALLKTHTHSWMQT